MIGRHKSRRKLSAPGTADRRVGDVDDLSKEDQTKLSDLVAKEIQRAIEDEIEYQMRPCAACAQPRVKGDHSKCVLF